MSKSAERPTHWAEHVPSATRSIIDNIEALAIAFVMALVVRQFALEVFKIPSDSMYPTLNGAATNGDRVIVNKARYLFGGPNRWEVTVFKYPLDVRRNFIKRLVGMPDERFTVLDGDIWVNGTIERKPPRVQRHVWFERFPEPTRFMRVPDYCTFKPGGAKWTGNRQQWSVTAGDAPARLDFDFGQPVQLRADRRYTYHDTRDYRLHGTVRAAAGATVGIEFTVRGRPFTITLPTSGNASIAFDRTPFAAVRAVDESGTERRLPADSTVDFEIAHWDWRLQVSIDGEPWFDYELDPKPWAESDAALFAERRREDPSAHPRRFAEAKSAIALTARGGAVTFDALTVDQDLHYTYASPDGVDELKIPAGHYFLMGDNSHGSRDSREWHRIQVKDPKTGELIWGEEYSWGLDSDQMFDQRVTNFVDLEGNPYTVPRFNIAEPRTSEATVAYEPFGLIPEDNLVGRGFCVFWPFPPFAPEFRPKLIR